MHLQSTSAEESSILKGARVEETNLRLDLDWKGKDLIGNSFKDFIGYRKDRDSWKDGTSQFVIYLEKAFVVKTAFILNFCEVPYDGQNYWDNREWGRDLNGPAYIYMGRNFDLEIISPEINDGGFFPLNSKSSNFFSYRRNGSNARGGTTMYLNAIKLYETVNLLEE